MGQFQYTARTVEGERTTGTIAANSLAEANRLLRDGDKFVVDLRPVAGSAQEPAAGMPMGRVKREHVVAFTHQLAVMIDSGVTITEALDCAIDQAENEAARYVFDDVRRTVEAGERLSDALEKHNKVFPTVMITLVRASEASGTLGRMLDRVTSYMTKEMQAIKKMRGTMIYPAIMAVMVLGVSIFLLTFVMPRMAEVYNAKGASLPLLTQIVLAMSHALTGYWYIWVIGAVAAVGGVVFGLRTERGRRMLDYCKVQAPILGRLYRKLYINRSCRTMGMMIAAGVPILDIVELVKKVNHNRYYEDVWQRVANKLEGGAQVSEELFKSSLFPRFVSQMIASGEKSGKLGQVLDRVAEVTEQEFDEQVKTSTQMIEPAMILIMGSIIGFMALAMLLPIFTVSRVVAG
jgi:type IV pilus assembly protein PilC